MAFLAVGCSSPDPYTYKYVPGYTATLGGDGRAVAPEHAPDVVRVAIDAGNEIVGSAYVYGGGHGSRTGGYDCSGTVSYVLHAVGRLRESSDSRGFLGYGESGYGRWISVYARSGHVFMVVAGLRLDTGWTGQPESGPCWTMRSRPTDGCVVRHPEGL